MGSDSDFVASLVAEENALLRSLVLLRMHARQSTSIASSSVDGKGAIDVTPCLVELDSLPGILGSLADARAVDDCTVTSVLSLGVVVRLHVLALNVSLDLILSESQGKIQLEGLIVLPRLRFLKACLIRIGRRT